MDLLVSGSGNAINLFIILSIIFVIMFTIGKITFKQLMLISLTMIVIVMTYLKYTANEPTATKPDPQLSSLINNLANLQPSESANNPK